MYGDEIFIVGKPPILLYSKDAGKSWVRVPLNPKVRWQPQSLALCNAHREGICAVPGALGLLV